MKQASRQRNRRNRKLGRKRRQNPVHVRARKRRMGKTRLRGRR